MHEEALECFNKIIEIDPEQYRAHIKIGLTLCAMGNHGEAIKCFDKAIQIDPR
jgi:tetratricopeptide (TPR) repeat protein